MNAEESVPVLKDIADAIADGGPRTMLETLKDVYVELDQHRLAMEEAAETSPAKCDSCGVELCGHGRLVCPACCEAAEPTCPGALIPYDVDKLPDRLDATDKRIDTIRNDFRAALDFTVVDSYAYNVNERLNVQREKWEQYNKRIVSIEKRLAKIERALGLRDD